MVDQKIEFLTENGKDIKGLAKLLLRELPKIGFEFINAPPSGMANCRYPRSDIATYAFEDKKTKRPAVFYRYELKDSVYNVSLDLSGIARDAYESILSLAGEGYPRLFKQKVA